MTDNLIPPTEADGWALLRASLARDTEAFSAIVCNVDREKLLVVLIGMSYELGVEAYGSPPALAEAIVHRLQGAAG